MTVVRPPVPVSCASRPLVGGVVAPWANVRLADGGVDFRSQHESRVQRCWRECLCQLCGSVVGQPIVFFGGPRQVGLLQFDEPPLHPECAVYASQACPMVAGRMERYGPCAPVSAGHRGSVCAVAGCECGGWVATPGLTPDVGGDPAHDWYAVYVSGFSLGVAAGRLDRVHAGVVAAEQVLVVRHVSAPGVGRTWVRASLDQLVGRGIEE